MRSALTCRHCGKTMHIDEFYPDSAATPVVTSGCRECQRGMKQMYQDIFRPLELKALNQIRIQRIALRQMAAENGGTR